MLKSSVIAREKTQGRRKGEKGVSSGDADGKKMAQGSKLIESDEDKMKV